MDGSVTQLPDGWIVARLRDLIPKARPKIPADPNSRLPFIGMDHIEPNSFHLIGQDVFGRMKSAGSYFQSGDVLYGRLRPYLNKVHRANFEGVASAEFIIFPSSKFYDSDFLKYLLHQREFVNFATSRSSGDRPRVKFDDIADFEFLLPPLNEQRRIAEKIGTLFAQLDKGEEMLRRVQKLLGSYRRSVLKAAVSGQLTADWRSDNAEHVEHGRDLVARILRIRRETLQGRGRYKEPAFAHTTGLLDLPRSWAWATIEQLSSAVDYGTSAKCGLEPTGVPVLRMGNISDGALDLRDLKYLPDDHPDLPKLLLESGDLLFNRTNSAELVGKTAVYRGTPTKCSYASYLIRVRLIGVLPEFVSAFINSAFGRIWIRSVVSQQVGQANVNGSKLRALTVPVPPIAEQEVIVERMTACLSRTAAVAAWCNTELSRSAALRQAILKEALAGRLVARDSAEGPRAEFAAQTSKARPTVSGQTLKCGPVGHKVRQGTGRI